MGANFVMGATFDVAELKSGLDTTVEQVRTAGRGISVVFEEVHGKTKTQLAAISDDTKVMAASVTDDWIRAANASREYVSAQSDVRNAMALAKAGKLDEATATSLLAAAQQRLTAVTAELTSTKKAAAQASAKAAEEEALSQNVVVRAFQRTALAAKESATVVREQMAGVVEAAGLEAGGIEAGFAGLAAMLGPLIAVQFLAEYLDGLAKMNVQLDHLSVRTGIAITDLAGLQQIVKQMGGEWDPIATGIARMERNLADSKAPTKELTDALAGIGVKIEELKGLKPEEQLNLLSAAFQRSGNAANNANAAIALFGRGGVALIPVLREQGDQLAKNMKATGELTGVTEQSAEAARRWTQDMAVLSAELRSMLMPVLEHVDDVLRGLGAQFGAEIAGIKTFTVLWTSSMRAVLASTSAFGAGLHDLMTGQFGKLAGDSEAARSGFVNAFKQSFQEVEQAWTDTYHVMHDKTPVPKIPEADQDVDLGTEGADGRKAAREELEHDEEELNQMRHDMAQKGHLMTLKEETDFWEARLAQATKGTEEYRELLAKVAPLEQREVGAGQGRKAADAQVLKDQEQLNAELTQAAIHGHNMQIADEVAFWRQKLETARKNSVLYLEIQKKIDEIQKTDRPRRGGDAVAVTFDADAMKQGIEEINKAWTVEAEVAKQAIRDETEAYRSGIEEQIRLTQQKFQDTVQKLDSEVALHHLTASKKVAATREAAQQELETETQLIRAKEMLDMNDVKRYQQDLNEQARATQQFAQRIEQINRQAAQQVQQNWDKVWQRFNQDFNTAIMSVSQGTEKASQAFAKMFGSLIRQLEEWILQWLEKKAEMWVQEKVQGAAAATEKKTQDAAFNAMTVQGDAAVAAAGAMAFYSATAAPAAAGLAAAQYGATIAFLPAATFDAGGMVGNNFGVEGFRGVHVPILAEQGERILTPEQTENFHRLVDQQQAPPAVTRSGAGDTHLHYEPTIQAYDRSGFRSMLKAHSQDVLDLVKQGYRNGKLT